MAYTRYYTTWHDYPITTTPVVAAFLQALEDFLVTVTPGIAAPAAPATNDALVYNGSTWTNAKIVNANVDPAAAIAYSKLLLTASVVNGDISASAAIAYSKLNLAASVTNADIATAAAIAYSKLNLSASIVNADVATSAAIAYSKLNLATSIVNADIATSAAIAISKLAGYPSDATKFLRGDGTWAVPASTSAAKGVATVSWPGGASISSGTTVTHGFGSTPTSVTASMKEIVSGVSVVCAIQASSYGATTFLLTAQTIDGSLPAAASSITVGWHAL